MCQARHALGIVMYYKRRSRQQFMRSPISSRYDWVQIRELRCLFRGDARDFAVLRCAAPVSARGVAHIVPRGDYIHYDWLEAAVFEHTRVQVLGGRAHDILVPGT